MPRRWRARLEDILEACQRVGTYVSGDDERGFLANRQAVEAVAFNLLVIGEAAGALPPAVTDRSPTTPWHELRGMRNRIAHRYYDIDPHIVWHTARTSIPALAVAVRALLAAPGEE